MTQDSEQRPVRFLISALGFMALSISAAYWGMTEDPVGVMMAIVALPFAFAPYIISWETREDENAA